MNLSSQKMSTFTGSYNKLVYARGVPPYVGRCMKMTTETKIVSKVNTHKNSLSSTMATSIQSVRHASSRSLPV